MADLTEMYQTPELQNLQSDYQTAATQASAYESAANLLPQKLRQAIQEKLDYNKDIIEQKNKAMAEYFQAPSAAREKYQDIWNPFQREKLVAQERNIANMGWQNLEDIYANRMGDINDLIAAATGSFNAQVGAQQNKAQIARQAWQDALELADKLSEGKYREEQLAQDWANINKSGSGSVTERMLAEAQNGLINDIASYTDLKTIVQKYSSEIPLYQIVNAYNTFHKTSGWGPAKESMDEIQSWTVKPTASMIEKNELLKTEGTMKLTRLDEAISALENNPGLTGPTSGRLLGLKTMIPGLSNEEERAIQVLISEARSGKLFEVGGKSLTKQEKLELKNLLPDETLPAETNLTRLKALRALLADKYNSAQKSSYTSGVNYDTGGEWE